MFQDIAPFIEPPHAACWIYEAPIVPRYTKDLSEALSEAINTQREANVILITSYHRLLHLFKEWQESLYCEDYIVETRRNQLSAELYYLLDEALIDWKCKLATIRRYSISEELSIWIQQVSNYIGYIIRHVQRLVKIYNAVDR